MTGVPAATPPAAPVRQPRPLPATHLVERRSRVSLGLRELWQYRELLAFFVWRDLKVRYRQTLLGAAWAVLQPFITMVVFSVFLGRLVGVPSDGVPYPLFAFAALVPWTFVSQGVSQSANSLVGNQNLIKKVYFPRLVIPCAAVLAGLADFAIAFVVLVAMMLAYAIVPGAAILWVPLFLLLGTTTALAAGLWLSALNVRYRDVRYVVPFFLQVWLFATPVAYPSSLVAEPWRTLYALNPMAGVVEGFRWALLGTGGMPAGMLLVSSAVAVVVLATGAWYFRRAEATFADVV
jgi:lipopolysaccharide transport system permease protein